ncbi:hypothetical protein JAAARDRAFT_412891 [Jaapia argillacea MUCL 33604]|uniref:Uncharacterized protein n=1 Tax=Jaapia argillacea MUCL 33604 TaxID=933084 RepID=A0A067PGU2_9AGAM|nr:hypothetical protein JAAARDRAFT_412891 [Jaapia argillacea MUCL 33604]
MGRTSIIYCAITRGAFEPYLSCFAFRPPDSGFCGLGMFNTSLSHQMEMYFECVRRARGYEVFEREGWGLRLTVEMRVSEAPADSENTNLNVSDMARLMKLFQNSLFEYWEHRTPRRTFI